MGNGESRIGVVCDFDGTITMDDMAVVLLRAFARGAWQRWDEEFTTGRITVEDVLQRQFALVRASRKRLTAYALAHARIRPGFPEFVAFCRGRGIPLIVASAGLEFYIRAILERAGLACRSSCAPAPALPGAGCGSPTPTCALWRKNKAWTSRNGPSSGCGAPDAGLSTSGMGCPISPPHGGPIWCWPASGWRRRAARHGVPYRTFTDFYAIMAALAEELA
ncbi:MAG: HAD-IB family phosphatase [Chloroflexi bacterium]|nr:HAD-IB family phosphatase [Chloroflexota bacterium]